MVSHLEQFQVPFFVHKSNSAASPLVELALGCFFFHIGGAFLHPSRDHLVQRQTTLDQSALYMHGTGQVRKPEGLGA